ncbi:MAG TPA: serine hydrolase [Jatrophihabitans sp.]|jgi:beta-lactamase class A|nr:serine hydrolase [Jatrophihabitans sp.]
MRTGRLTAALAVAAVLLTADAGGWRTRTVRHCCAGAAGTKRPPSGSPAMTLPVSVAPYTSVARASVAPVSVAPSPIVVRPATSAPVRTPAITAERLAADLSRLFGAGNSYSVAALDLSTGRSSRAGAGGGMVLASLVKLDLLETLLYQHQRSGQPLTASQDGDVSAMIERSDNAAADRVFRLIGENAGLRYYHSVLGLHDTVLNAEGQWGLSTTSAGDQLILLRALTSAGSPLTATSRRYALALMSNLESDQRWGVSAAADPGSTTAAKNGWLGIDSDGERWAVNSAGVVRIGGHQVLMVVLSQHQQDFSTAVARVQRAAVELAGAL